MSSFALDQVTVASPLQFAASLVKATSTPLRETLVLAYLHNDGCQHIEAFPVTSDWVEIVEAVQNTIRMNTYEQVIICVYTSRLESELPFKNQVKDLTAVISDSIHVLDELLIDGNRLWSYMCDGCCDPDGSEFTVEPNNQITIDYTWPTIPEALISEASELVHENVGVNSIKAFPQWKYSFHSIRHWFASQGLQSGVGVVQVARLLGHRSTATTQEVYGHLMAEGSEAVIKSVQDAIGDQ